MTSSSFKYENHHYPPANDVIKIGVLTAMRHLALLVLLAQSCQMDGVTFTRNTNMTEGHFLGCLAKTFLLSLFRICDSNRSPLQTAGK